jgi:NTP pyrophosphatase (non-canonical NTP hydrolase)
MESKEILMEIAKERVRQDHLHPENKIGDYLPILIEEVGEVARAIQIGDLDNLKEELIQVMAVCYRWMVEL